jgi:multiple sugar transport system substrate-binding protein
VDVWTTFCAVSPAWERGKVEDTTTGLRKIDRRRFVKGVGVGAVALSLGACGVDVSQTRQGGKAASELKGDFSWTREKGKTVHLIFAKHPLSDALIKSLPDFEKRTGIKVEYDALPEEEFRQKLLTDLSTGQGSNDGFMTGPVTDWQYAAAGWIEPLDEYIKNPALTSPDYDFEDFYPATIEVNRWDQQDGLGKGNLWVLPANEEGYSLFYRTDILETTGIGVPQTVDDLIAVVKEVDGKCFAGKRVDGFVARGDKTWPTVTTGYSTVFFSHGATDVTPDGQVAVNSPEGVEATEKWAELISYAPNNVGTFTWYEAMNHFAAGNAAFFIDADHMSETFESPDSSIADTVGYAPPPSGPAGRASNIWLWSARDVRRLQERRGRLALPAVGYHEEGPGTEHKREEHQPHTSVARQLPDHEGIHQGLGRLQRDLADDPRQARRVALHRLSEISGDRRPVGAGHSGGRAGQEFRQGGLRRGGPEHAEHPRRCAELANGEAEATGETFRLLRVSVPNPENRGRIIEAYGTYAALTEALAPAWSRMESCVLFLSPYSSSV